MIEIEDEKLAAMTAELEALRPYKDGLKKDEFEAKQKEWLDEKGRLEQEANPNWKKTREQIEALKVAAEKNGVKLDENGMPKPDTVSKDEIVREAVEATRKEALNIRLDELLEDYNTEEAAVIKRQYEKLTSGEEVSMQNIRSFVDSAVGASGLGGTNRVSRAHSVGGQGPRVIEKSEEKLDDSIADEVAGMMGIRIKK